MPLLARVLLLAEKPLDGVALEQEMQGVAARASDEAAVVAQDFAANVARARDHLVQRGMIAASDRGYAPVDGQRPALRFYANSIAHFFDR